jgi:4-diphosphocytidyl-2-C-methyl-D-erythritol kinase
VIGQTYHTHASAKVNLHLTVRHRRPDGFHELVTVFHAVDLYDELAVMAIDKERVDLWMRFADQRAEIEIDIQDNLVYKAASLLMPFRPGRGAIIALIKRIPIGGGLGGGSSDAAVTLAALKDLRELKLSQRELAAMAIGLGSDVPFFLGGGTALGRGRGEILDPLPAPNLWFILGLSHKGLGTAAVFSRWDRSETQSGPGPEDMDDALETGDPARIAAALHNDLEVAAFSLRPDLALKKQALVEAGALGALVSGSGPTVFGIAADARSAHEIARKVRALFDSVAVVPSAVGASSPSLH